MNPTSHERLRGLMLGGAITDPTQMTLFTLEGLLRARVRFAARGICDPASVIHRAQQRWREARSGPPGSLEDPDGHLISQPALWSRRAPKGVDRPCGAGVIAHMGPIGLAQIGPNAFEVARQLTSLTHRDVTVQMAAGWFAAWIEAIAAEPSPSLAQAARSAWDACAGQDAELDAALQRAFDLAQQGPRDQVPGELGEGREPEEVVAIALWCALTVVDPFEAVCLAVNIDGDSPTTGALVGQVMGARHGPGWIPASRLEALALRDLIEEIVDDATILFGDMPHEDTPAFDALWERYPGS